jgi:hypothetical protein
MAEIRSAASKPKRRTVPIQTGATAIKLSSADEPAQQNQQQVATEKVAGSGGDQSGLAGGETPTNANRLASSADPRDSLLASIRLAAGKPARRSTTRRPAEMAAERKRQTGEDSSVSTSGPSLAKEESDLMSDLVSKLRARRDGISGKNQPIKLAAEPLDTVQQRLMVQVSSLIPEVTAPAAGPAARGRAPASDDDDDDGGADDDDWQA